MLCSKPRYYTALQCSISCAECVKVCQLTFVCSIPPTLS